MFPFDTYAEVRRRQEDLLRQADLQRMTRMANYQKLSKRSFQRQLANWLGMGMVRLGHKLESFGALEEACSSSVATDARIRS